MVDHPASLRTPLARVRFLGSARSGTREARLIHLTSLALIPLTLGFVWLVLDLLHMDYNGVRETLERPLPAIVLLAFILAGILHMEIGMRSIVVDYIHGPARAWALLANTCFSALLGLACVYATLRIAFT
ncbi:MAG: succinate dehydrogenase, hydrophobic membrane anchor protein [Hyphomicrobiales bacterium]|nr:succinate dehydrogenase, hydrophobic membrane anchor protein [Hyphomicrobiales bacterium]MBV8442058.1 succinate dehydrogenase, hydrophobic membrane anchor protein [Hyphomicrobiales bacterium]